MADEGPPLRSSMSQKSMASHHDPEAEKSIEEMLVGPAKFTMPDTSVESTPMQRQFDERDFQSHRNEAVHVHHPLSLLPRKSSKVSLKLQSQSTPGPLDPAAASQSTSASSTRKSVPTSLPLSKPITQSVQPVGSQESQTASDSKEKLGKTLSVPEISVTTVNEVEPEEEKEIPKKKAMFTIGGEDEEEEESHPFQETPRQPLQETHQQPSQETPHQPIRETPHRPLEEAPPKVPGGMPIDVSASSGHHRHHHHKDRSHHKHHHHHHHHRGRHSDGDLLSRTRQGSHTALGELSRPQLPTEPEEAVTLNMADLEDIAEHRLGVVHRRHKPKTRERVNSIIHVARSRHSSATSMASSLGIELNKIAVEEKIQKEEKTRKKSRKKSVPIKKQYDHRPHEVFVELDELFKEEGHEMQWKEKARWIKFEEDVEEGTDRWGKPHVASLTFHSLVELRKLLEHGSVLMDLEEWELSEIFHRVTDNLITSDQVQEQFRGEILRALLIKHKHVHDRHGILRNVSQISLSSLAKTPSDANFRHGFFKNLQTPTSSYGHEKLVKKSSSDAGGAYVQLSQSNESNNANKDDVRIVITPAEDSSKPADNDKSTEHNRRNGVASMAPLPSPSRAHSSGDLPSPTKQKEPGMGMRRITSPELLKHALEPETQPKSTRQKLEGIMRKIPRDAEATTVLVGELSSLEKPALCFVRLAEGTLLNGLTEVPIPVRFLFVLLGPGGGDVDYHEIGRCFSTLMSNEHFHEVAYKADDMPDILSAMNAFIDDSMVLPAGNWDKELLLPILREQNQKMKQRWQKVAAIPEEDEEAALLDETDSALVAYKKPKKKAEHINPLLRTGIPFGGVINDVKRRYPHFISDFTDALNTQCLAAIFFLFFAAMSPVITFGGVLSQGTDNYMGVSEMLLGSAICGTVFALFSGQPITIIGVTGPILVFEETLFMFCKTSGVEYLPFRFWVGIWLFLITIVTVAVEASVLVRYFTRFTEEVFAFLIAIVFMKEVFKKIHKIFVYHPLKEDYCYSKYPYTTESMWSANTTEWEEATMYETVFETVSGFLAAATTPTVPMFNSTDEYPGKCATSIPKPLKYQPNTALLSTILMLGTFLLAWFFKMFRHSKFLGKKGRKMIGDFGTSIAIMIMVGVDLGINTVYTEKIYIPDGLQPTDTCKRGWFVNPLGTDTTLDIIWIFAAAIPGFLAFILMFMETLIDGLIVDNPKNKMKKGSGFHLDLLLLGGLAALNGLLGLPWVWAATVRSVTHLHSLCVWSKSHAPGEKPRLLRVKEQRVTALVVNILIGLSIALAPLLNQIPIAVLFGVFLYMGVSSLNGIQMVDRVFLLAMPPKHHPDAQYVRGVRTWRMHLYTFIQLLCVIILAVIKSSKAAISFPFFLMLLVPARQLLNRVFTRKELEALDSHEGEDDDDDDEFHEAHMPV